jgi:hypothetical protein
VEGFAKAKAAGVYKGRPSSVDAAHQVLQLKSKGMAVEDRKDARYTTGFRLPGQGKTACYEGLMPGESDAGLGSTSGPLTTAGTAPRGPAVIRPDQAVVRCVGFPRSACDAATISSARQRSKRLSARTEKRMGPLYALTRKHQFRQGRSARQGETAAEDRKCGRCGTVPKLVNTLLDSSKGPYHLHIQMPMRRPVLVL